MSLIQSALEKTQTQTAPRKTNNPRVEKLRAWDRDIEESLSAAALGAREKVIARRQEKRVIFLLAILTLIALTYFVVSGKQAQKASYNTGSFYAPVQSQNPAATPSKTTLTPAPAKHIQTEEYEIYGISWDDAAPMAVINQQLVTVGDVVSKKATVTEITRTGATLEHNGRKIQLKFNPS